MKTYYFLILFTFGLSPACSDAEFATVSRTVQNAIDSANAKDANPNYDDAIENDEYQDSISSNNIGADIEDRYSDSVGDQSKPSKKNPPKKKKPKKPESIGGEKDETPPVYAGSSIAEKGKSLDLYFTIDVSDSLKKTDTNCDRLTAILDFKDALISYLGKDGDVRANFVKFSTGASYFGTEKDFLTISNSNFKAKYQKEICEVKGGTNTAAGLEETMELYRMNNGSQKETSSVIVLTDGSPTIDKILVPDRAAELQGLFGEQIYGVLLYKESPLRPSGPPQIGLDGLVRITGDAERVTSVSEANEIGKAVAWFLK